MSASTTAARAVRPPASSRTVLHVMPDLAIGGGQTIVLQGVRHMVQDHRVLVAVLDGGPTDLVAAFEQAGAEVRVVPHGGRLRQVLAVRRLLREEHVDLVQTHNDADRRVAQPAALLAGVPVVGHLHAEWVHLGNLAPAGAPWWRRARSAVAGRVRDAIERRVVRAYVAESVGVERIFAPLVHQPITVLAQSLPLEQFDAARTAGARERVRAGLGLGTEETVLVTVSRLVPGKGHEDLPALLEAVRGSGHPVRLLLVGEGELRAPLERAFAERGLSEAVVLAGNRPDVPAVLAACDVFVFPSYSEGFGMVALEASAAGCPVVAYDLPPFHEFLLPGRTALLVPLGDVAALTAAVLSLLQDPDRRRAMGEAASEDARRRFPADGVARVFRAVYDDVLGAAADQDRRRG